MLLGLLAKFNHSSEVPITFFCWTWDWIRPFVLFCSKFFLMKSHSRTRNFSKVNENIVQLDNFVVSFYCIYFYKTASTFVKFPKMLYRRETSYILFEKSHRPIQCTFHWRNFGWYGDKFVKNNISFTYGAVDQPSQRCISAKDK